MSDVTAAIPGLSWLKQNYPDLYGGYSQMIKGLRTDVAFDEKTLQLHTLSILTARQLTRGVGIHVRYAREAGATDEEILSAITVCFATCGIGPTVEAIEAVLPALAARPGDARPTDGADDAR
jgi:alkylhydroperoxidase/carboxymuconolactone decarboxylase family protein YurZ